MVDLKWIKKTLKALMYISVGLFTGLAIWQWVDFSTEDDGLCNTLSLVIPYFCNCVISVIFIVLGCKIQSSAKRYFEIQRGQYEDDRISPRGSQQIMFQNETQIRAMEE